MIVECPECSTQFTLPAERVTARGAKVRCSKCGHTFRVRLGADGGPEVYYKNEGVADPPTQDLADLFDESFAEDFDNAMMSTQSSAPGEHSDVVDPRNTTMIGFPSSGRGEGRSKSAAPDYNPFPFAALDEPRSHTPVPKQQHATTPIPTRGHQPTPHGIDLFDGQDPTIHHSTPEELADDPFADVFVDEPTRAPAPSNESLSAAPAKLGRQPAAPAAAAVQRPAPILKKPILSALPTDDLPDEAEILGNQASDFGPAEDLVDPSFGQGAYFDPEAGKPVTPTAAPPQAAAPPRPAAPRPAATAPPKVATAAARAYDDDLDFAPHRIGGGGFQKFVNFLFILVLVVVAVLGFIAVRTGGILDFGQFDNMMEILVEAKPYTPRDEWVRHAPAPPPPEPANPLSAQNVFARMVPVGKKDSVLVVSGDIANDGNTDSEPVKVRVMLLDEQQKVLSEVNTMSGRVIDLDAITDAKDADEVGQIEAAAPAGIKAKATAGFTAVFPDPPARAKENKPFLVRVEIR